MLHLLFDECPQFFLVLIPELVWREVARVLLDEGAREFKHAFRDSWCSFECRELWGAHLVGPQERLYEKGVVAHSKRCEPRFLTQGELHNRCTLGLFECFAQERIRLRRVLERCEVVAALKHNGVNLVTRNELDNLDLSVFLLGQRIKLILREDDGVIVFDVRSVDVLILDHIATHFAPTLISDAATVGVMHLVQVDIVVFGGAVELHRNVDEPESYGSAPNSTHTYRRPRASVNGLPVAPTARNDVCMVRSKPHTVTIDGRPVRLTNLDRVVYETTGTTKADIIDYYRQIAPVMLPHCEGRPVTRKRFPGGVDAGGEGSMFFQKDLGDGAPDWLDTAEQQHSDHVNVYPLANNLATLVWFAQMSALELHVPQWKFGPREEPQRPDRMVFDLDPGPGTGLPEAAEVAKLVRGILDGMGLDVVPVTSGSKGVHLYAPLDGSASSDEISQVAKELARSLEADHPDDIVSTMKKSERVGKVFIDWSQNNASKTTIAPYSLRGRARPWVAAPRTWRELGSPHLKHLEMHEVLERVKRRGDPMAEVFGHPSGARSGVVSRAKESHDASDEPAPGSTSSSDASVPADGVPRDSAPRDRLRLYRSMRDATKTREPIPADAPTPGTTTPVFVIQRHEATRLHYDFRLEHDGVLVSWALPKGVPTHPGRNHLAVQTEDHPMAYRFFEGEIPKGEYGGGTVAIWDSGTIDIEKWRNDGVTVTLYGVPDGGLGGSPKRFSLFETRRGDKNWLIRLTNKQPERNDGRASRGAAERPVLADAPSPSAPPEPLSPMLATLATEQEFCTLTADAWAFEGKWDGYRAIARIHDGHVTLTSRNQHDITANYPELASLTHLPVDSVTLDGEIVVLDDAGLTDFSRLQRGDDPVTFLAFDVLEVNGIETMRLPYRHRREVLNDLALTPAIQSTERERMHPTTLSVPAPLNVSDAAHAIATARELGLEGIVAKRLWSTYREGARTHDWLKLPFQHTAEVVIVGWRTSESDAAGFASLLVAIVDSEGGDGIGGSSTGATLRYAGRVSTGFTNRERRELRDLLAGLVTETPSVRVPSIDSRDATWVLPGIVAEVTNRGVTETGKLRHPSWRGLRPDKNLGTIQSFT